MNKKKSKKESKAVSVPCPCSGDCWACFLSFLTAKEHCAVLRVSKLVNTAGKFVRSWSPAVEAPTLDIAKQIQKYGCTAPPRELRLGFVPAACLQPYSRPTEEETKKWFTAKLQVLHFEVDARQDAIRLPNCSVAPFLQRLEVSVTGEHRYDTLGAIFLDTDDTTPINLAPTLQALVLRRFVIDGDAFQHLIFYDNLTVLRLEECRVAPSNNGAWWGLLGRLSKQLVELGTPKIVVDGYRSRSLYNVVPYDHWPRLIYLWGHIGYNETVADLASLLDTYMPNLQRLYAIPASVAELKEGNNQPGGDFFTETAFTTKRSCGVQKCTLYPADFDIDESVHRKRGGNWPTQCETRIDGRLVRYMETKSVWILYSDKPRAHGPFD